MPLGGIDASDRYTIGSRYLSTACSSEPWSCHFGYLWIRKTKPTDALTFWFTDLARTRMDVTFDRPTDQPTNRPTNRQFGVIISKEEKA